MNTKEFKRGPKLVKTLDKVKVVWQTLCQRTDENKAKINQALHQIGCKIAEFKCLSGVVSVKEIRYQQGMIFHIQGVRVLVALPALEDGKRKESVGFYLAPSQWWGSEESVDQQVDMGVPQILLNNLLHHFKYHLGLETDTELDEEADHG